MNKLRLNRKPTLLVLIAMIILGSMLFLDGGGLKLLAKTRENYEKLKIFSDVLTIIQKNYVEEVDLENLVYNSIKGMVSNLDPHSSFMPPDMYKEMQVETKGSFGGLGIEITIKDGVLTVVSPIEGTPADQVGIKSGDKIIKIEDEFTKNMSLMEAVEKMRGPKGTEITITVMREGFKVPQEFTIVRDIIKIKSVKYKLLEDKFIYVRLAQFQEDTAKEFKQALKKFESGDKPIKGLILDLRRNPGGLLDQAVSVCDEFLDSGLIVYTEGRVANQKMKFHAKKNKNAHDYPIVVLVNGGSASGSEIVAGALQDHGRAVIVGTQTFGKGTVQTIIPLSDGAGLRLTTAKYYTPSHHSIQEKGVTPDIIVEDKLPSLPVNEKKFQFIREKDLKNHFKGQEISDEEEQRQDEKENADDKEDPPLETALQILKGWEIFSSLDKKSTSE